MSFGPASLLVSRFKFSSIRTDGKARNAGKLVTAALVPAQPSGKDGTLTQNPIFEMASGQL
jgi:hypothetical protein